MLHMDRCVLIFNETIIMLCLSSQSQVTGKTMVRNAAGVPGWPQTTLTFCLTWWCRASTIIHHTITLSPAPHGCAFHTLRCDPSRCVHVYAWTHRGGSQRNAWKTHPCGAGLRMTVGRRTSQSDQQMWLAVDVKRAHSVPWHRLWMRNTIVTVL